MSRIFLEIMLELTKRIAEKLEFTIDEGLINSNSTFDSFDLLSHGEIVYPSIYKGLGINEDWRERKIFPGDRRDKAYAFKEYVRAYMDNSSTNKMEVV